MSKKLGLVRLFKIWISFFKGLLPGDCIPTSFWLRFLLNVNNFGLYGLFCQSNWSFSVPNTKKFFLLGICSNYLKIHPFWARRRNKIAKEREILECLKEEEVKERKKISPKKIGFVSFISYLCFFRHFVPSNCKLQQIVCFVKTLNELILVLSSKTVLTNLSSIATCGNNQFQCGNRNFVKKDREKHIF